MAKSKSFKKCSYIKIRNLIESNISLRGSLIDDKKGVLAKNFTLKGLNRLTSNVVKADEIRTKMEDV